MTIRDIAKLSGVGISTVSRVLNDSPLVSEASRKKVLEVIRKYNFVPNNSARDLVRTKNVWIKVGIAWLCDILNRTQMKSNVLP